jgi:hypothetical protein
MAKPIVTETVEVIDYRLDDPNQTITDVEKITTVTRDNGNVSHTKTIYDYVFTSDIRNADGTAEHVDYNAVSYFNQIERDNHGLINVHETVTTVTDVIVGDGVPPVSTTFHDAFHSDFVI